MERQFERVKRAAMSEPAVDVRGGLGSNMQHRPSYERVNVWCLLLRIPMAHIAQPDSGHNRSAAAPLTGPVEPPARRSSSSHRKPSPHDAAAPPTEPQYSHLQRPSVTVEGSYAHLQTRRADRQTAWEPLASSDAPARGSSRAVDAMQPSSSRTRINTVYEAPPASSAEAPAHAPSRALMDNSAYESQPPASSRTHINTVYEPQPARRKVSFEAAEAEDEEEDEDKASAPQPAVAEHISLEQNLLELQDIERTLHELLVE